MAKHNWTFKKYFRREAYGWNGTSTASKRMKEAVSEIKTIAKTDSALAGEGVIELFCRLYPALMNIDSSSGALGTAMHRTINALIPILIEADWDMNTRGKWLEKLYDAIEEDGWGTFDGLRDYWGELCVFPGLANLWGDRLLPMAKDAFFSEKHSHFVGTDMCLSCLLYTERYEELQELLGLQRRPFWFYNQFWAKALIRQGKPDQAIDYAQQILAKDKTGNDRILIERFCETTLIEMGKIEEAYEHYGRKIPSYGTYLNIYRGICKRYPWIDKKKILMDCISQTPAKGKWFASAKTAGFLDIALDCARSNGADPYTLLRACRDFAAKEPEFALQVGVLGILSLMTDVFYEDIQPRDVIAAYVDVERFLGNAGLVETFKEQLDKDMAEHPCKDHLRDAIVDYMKRSKR